MALSRIWSAFIIIAITVAGIKCFFLGDSQIFMWMVSGKAADAANPVKVGEMSRIALFDATRLTAPSTIHSKASWL